LEAKWKAFNPKISDSEKTKTLLAKALCFTELKDEVEEKAARAVTTTIKGNHSRLYFGSPANSAPRKATKYANDVMPKIQKTKSLKPGKAKVSERPTTKNPRAAMPDRFTTCSRI
jgi:hypothetical protein